MAVTIEPFSMAPPDARAELSAGSRAAPLPSFDEVYSKHASFVFRVLRGMGVHDAQLDDALQDVFVVVHQRLPEFEQRARITTWLFEITLRVAQRYRRKTQRTRDHEPLHEELAADAQTPLEHSEAMQLARKLHALLEDLDDDKRALIVLAELEELTVPEISQLTGTPVNTVYTRLRRARSAFATLWQKRGGGR